MNWIRDWVFLVVRPFLTQLKNRLANIKLEKLPDGDIRFTNAENQGLDIEILNEKEATDIAVNATISGALTLNPNPYFTNGDLDYKGFVDNYDRASIVQDVVPNAAAALKLTGSVLTLVGDVYCPMPESLEYKASIDVKVTKDGLAEEGGSIIFYLGIVSYDSDKFAIYPQNIGYVNTDGNTAPNTDPLIMELTRDLTGVDVYFTFKTGDITKIALVNQPHFRANKFHKKQSSGDYCYIGINGRIYDHLGMSQDIKYNAWTVLDDTKADNDPLKYIELTGEQVDGKDEYRLQLTSKLEPKNASISYTVGDVWLQTFGGGTYAYWISAQSVPVDAKYHHYESAWFKPTDQDGLNEYGKYRNGTASVKLMMLPSYYYKNNDHVHRSILTEDNIDAYYGNIALLKRNI